MLYRNPYHDTSLCWCGIPTAQHRADAERMAASLHTPKPRKRNRTRGEGRGHAGDLVDLLTVGERDEG